MESAAIHLDRIAPDRLQDLLAAREGPCVSIFMPTHRVWNEARHDVIRLKNLLGQAAERLVDHGARPSEANKLLQPARELEGDESFWRFRSDGLALFLSSDAYFQYRLPIEFEELVTVGDRFHVKPLLPLVAEERHFHVLSLNLENVRLLTGTQYELREQPLEDTFVRLSEFMRLDEFERQNQLHSGSGPTTGGAQGAVFHGHGASADAANQKKRIIEFFRQVDNGVRRALAQDQTPLVLAGQDHLRGLFRSVNHYDRLEEESVDGNPEGMDVSELHEKAWRVVAPRFRQERLEAARAFEHLVGKEPGRASDRIEDIVPAAFFRRVKVLFVRGDCHEWGRFDPDRQETEIHDELHPGDQDLLDMAVANTLRYSGTVYLEDGGSMPSDAEAAAIFRY